MKFYKPIFPVVIFCSFVHQASGVEVNLESLKNGEIIIEEDVKGGKEGGVKATFWVNATPEMVYKILSDGGKFSEFMPDIVISTVEKSEKDFQDVYFKLHFWFGDVEYLLHRVLEADKMRISWNLLKGRFKRLDGHWKISPCEGGAVVTYYTNLEAGIYVPRRIITYLIKRSLPELVDAVKKRVESGGKWKKK